MMTTNKNEPTSRGVNQKALEQAIRDNMSPEGVVAICALLQGAGSYRNGTPENEAAINEVVWFHDTLLAMIGIEQFNALADEISL